MANCKALSPTNFLRNYYLLTQAALMRHTKIYAIIFLQQHKHQRHMVVGITRPTDRAGIRSVRTYSVLFFRQGTVKQLKQLHPPWFLDLTKQWKNLWSESVYSIDFTHSRRLAWNIINNFNLAGTTRHRHQSCPFFHQFD